MRNQALPIFLILIIPILSCPYLLTAEESSRFILENGLKVVCLADNRQPIIHLVVGINVGTKNEVKANSGITHLLEHILLVGSTQKRASDENILLMRKNGIHFNAHTERDLMTFELSFPNHHLSTVLDWIKEKIFFPRFNDDEMVREKEAIIEEIKQFLDDPYQSAASLALENLCQNHPYQSPIYGNPETVRQLTPDQLTSFHQQFFVPANSAMALVGDFNLADIKTEIEKTFNSIKKVPVPVIKINPVPPVEKNIELTRKMDINLGHLVIGFLAPEYYHEDQMAINVLSYIGGNGINPIIRSFLLNKRFKVEKLSVNYYAMQHSGAVLIYLTFEPKKLKPIQREVFNALQQMRSLNYSQNDFLPSDQLYITDYLETAKNYLLYQYELFKEDALNQAFYLCRALLFPPPNTAVNFNERLKTLSSTDLRKIVGKYLLNKKTVIVSVLPLSEK